jgi:hypothetical protein
MQKANNAHISTVLLRNQLANQKRDQQHLMQHIPEQEQKRREKNIMLKHRSKQQILQTWEKNRQATKTKSGMSLLLTVAIYGTRYTKWH